VRAARCWSVWCIVGKRCMVRSGTNGRGTPGSGVDGMGAACPDHVPRRRRWLARASKERSPGVVSAGVASPSLRSLLWNESDGDSGSGGSCPQASGRQRITSLGGSRSMKERVQIDVSILQESLFPEGGHISVESVAGALRRWGASLGPG
jgi:hypothetical protein